MKTLLTCLLAMVLSAQLFAQTKYAILPKPTRLDEKSGSFTIPSRLAIAVPAGNDNVRQIAQLFADQIAKSSGNTPAITTGKASKGISFVLEKEGSLGAEGYKLTVSPRSISIAAEQPQGFFYGVQSLMQLMPSAVFSPTKVEGVTWSVPACIIDDRPRYSYRGSMLDAGRNFMPVPFIKKYIDLLALHKMNTFHWHLTEDQGWRIEIKKYPELTTIGSKRSETMKGHYTEAKYDGKPYGGFYTQEQIKDVLKYAEDRFVNVIPEIEMPGHALAALAAYPQLGNNPDKIYKTGTKWGVYDDVFMPREETLQFLENVLSEVIELFPSKYIHIGGDECPKTQWEESRFAQDLIKKENLKDEHGLQSYVIKRIDKFITAKGRRMIGWDEILEGGLSPNATVMSWRGIEGGITAAKENHDVVMTPTTHVYFDYYQADAKTQPLAIGGFVEIKKTYSFDPTPDVLNAEQAKHILGVQGNVWTEYMPTTEYVEYMVFPRGIAVAEVGWTTKENKNFEDFTKRLEAHKKRLDYLGVNYYGAPINSKFEYVWPAKK
jgi:hexosaminidase